MLLLCVGSCTCESVSHTHRILLCAWRSCLVDMSKVASTLIIQQGWRNTQVWLEAICNELNQHPCWGAAILSTRRKAWSKDYSCQLTSLAISPWKLCCFCHSACCKMGLQHIQEFTATEIGLLHIKLKEDYCSWILLLLLDMRKHGQLSSTHLMWELLPKVFFFTIYSRIS